MTKITYTRLLTLIGCKDQPKRVIFDKTLYEFNGRGYLTTDNSWLSNDIVDTYDDVELAKKEVIEVLE